MGEVPFAHINPDVRHPRTGIRVLEENQVAGPEVLFTADGAPDPVHLQRGARQFHSVGLAEYSAGEGRAIHSRTGGATPLIGDTEIGVDHPGQTSGAGAATLFEVGDQDAGAHGVGVAWRRADRAAAGRQQACEQQRAPHRLSAIVEKTPPRFAAQVAPFDHFAQELARAVLRVLEALFERG